jgi:glycerol-3-phosphate dehydrogenase
VQSDVDVVVIGAGIHGVGVAQAAAAAGYSVWLLEQNAPACGSSSRSSKLIHGGLRYLESGQFHLVHESLRERALMLQLAPQLVQLRRFHIPIYQHTRRRPLQLRAGLSLYALLTGMHASARFGSVPRSQWGQLDGLDTQQLQHVFWYQDAQTDDRRLTLSVLASAQQLGARLLCPARMLGARVQAQQVTIRYLEGQRERQCRARVLINAAGPWAATLAQTIEPPVTVPRLELMQGSHIIVPGRLERGPYYVESPRDGRAIFMLPWQGQIMVGTTETHFHGDPASVAPSTSEIQYLLGVLKHYFPRFRSLANEDILGRFAGLRVLPQGPGHAFHRSRETLLVHWPPRAPRVMSIYGGKLTTWRAVSARVLRGLRHSLPARAPIARTDRLPLLPPA